MSDESEFKRLRWRCRRGMRELDQLMGRYLDQAWTTDPEPERALFLRLLDTEDDMLWRWFMGHEESPDAHVQALVSRIRSLPP